MGTIAEKLSYLADTKDLFKDRLNSLGAEITSSTTFRNYLNWLDTFYGEVSDKTNLSQNGIVGRTSQESTTGKNKYGITSVLTKVYGSGLPISNTNNIIVDEYDLNNIKFHTNAVSQYYQVLFPTYQLEPNTSYVITYNRTNNLSSGANARRFIYSLDNENNYAIIHYLTAGDNGDMSYTFTTTETGKVAIAFGFYNNASVNSSEINNLMVRLANESDVYEPYTYGSSPNPNFQQPINNLSGNVNYKIEGKNIFNVTDLTTITISDNGRATHTTTSDKIIATTGTPSGNSGVYIRDIGQYVDNYDSTKEYKVSFDVKASQSLSFKYGQDGKTLITTNIDTNLTRLSISTLLGTSGFIFYSTQNRAGDTIEISNIMISESEDTTYEKYTGIRTFNIPLGDIELCKIDTYDDKIYSSNGRFYLYKEIYKNKMLSSYSWYLSNFTNFKFRSKTLRPSIADEKCYCNLYKQASINDVFYGRVDYGVGLAADAGIAFRNKDIPYNIDAWKTYLDNNDVILYYGLEIPTTTEITQENYSSLYNALKQIQDYLTAYKINKEFILGYSNPTIEY